MPAELANLLDLSEKPIRSSSANIKLHPSMVNGINPENILKLQKFSIWAEHQVRTGKTPEEVLANELVKFKMFEKRTALRVKYIVCDC